MQQGITQSDMSYTGAVARDRHVRGDGVAVSYLRFRFRRLEPFLDPQPLIVVQDGDVIDANLRKERMTVDELLAEARLQQISSLADIRWGVLESNGKVSFIKKS